jgi:II/X family phage/plasmid replication protein
MLTMPMIDWVTAVIPCTHKDLIVGGSILCFDRDGNEEWSTEKALSVVGSFDNRIQIKTHQQSFETGKPSHLWISGNPVKFLQGHNIFGSCDLVYLMSKLVDAMILKGNLGICPTDFELALIRQGKYVVTRVDVNQSYHLANHVQVLSWIKAAANSSRLRYRGRGQFSGDTLYHGKSSRRWALKCYSKFLEIMAKGHKLPPELLIPQLLDWADKSLRIEAVIRSMELKRRGLDFASAWTPEAAKLLLQDLIGHLEMTDSFILPDEVVELLPTRLKPVYSLWISGHDMHTQYARRTFYRHRSELLKYGIDIAITQESLKSNVVPLIQILRAVPAEIPDWAYELKLVV